MALSIMSLLVTFLSLFVIIQASPVTLVPRSALDVWSPRIIRPDAETEWTIAQIETVEWDVSDAPDNISNQASVVLNGGGAQHILASGFNLRDGCVNVTVPLVQPGRYYITLFGDSGNWSPEFAIGF